MSGITVVLVDDHPALRAGLRAQLERADGITVLGEASNGEENLRQCLSLRPDVLVLDMEMPGTSGVEVARRLREAGSAVRVLALSAYNHEEYVAALLDGGAAGYLTKQESLESITAAIRGIAGGEEGWLSRDVAAGLVQQRRAKAAAETPLDLLTERECEVLALLAHGLANVDVGERLFIAESTVKKHVNNIYFKLEVKTRAEAVALAWKTGLVGREGAS